MLEAYGQQQHQGGTGLNNGNGLTSGNALFPLSQPTHSASNSLREMDGVNEMWQGTSSFPMDIDKQAEDQSLQQNWSLENKSNIFDELLTPFGWSSVNAFSFDSNWQN